MGGGSNQLQQQQQLYGTNQAASALQQNESLVDQLEFEERLKFLKKQSEEKKIELSSAYSSQNDILATPNYDNPQPLSTTLFGNKENAATEREYGGASFGPSQIGLAVASLALVGVFLVANGGSELGYATRKPSSSNSMELAPEQKNDLETALQEATTKLQANANDLDALEASAVLNAKLGKFDIAEQQLVKLSKAKPGNVDVLRVLAETQSTIGNTGNAVETYRRAWAASGESNLEILTGLTTALGNDNQSQVAVDLVRSLLSNEAVTKNIGDVELGLLLAKAYSQWRGHIPDALAQYDQLIEKYADDFRPLLGKGLLLRQQGREGDAQRMFIQARYLAPASSRGIVDAFSAKNP